MPKPGSNQGIPQWANKLWSIQAMEYYSAPKRNELLNHQKTWRKLKCVLLLNERSQYQKSTPCVTPTMGHSRKGASKRPVVARGCGEEWMYKIIEGFWGSENTLIHVIMSDMSSRHGYISVDTCHHCCLVAKSCLTLFWPHWSLPGSFVYRISQVRISKCVTFSFFRGSSQPWDWNGFSCIAGVWFSTGPLAKPNNGMCLVTQSRPTLCHPYAL